MKLIKFDFDKEKINSYGNMFLIGNGHIGYRGTLEEYRASEFVGLNIVGQYDQYEDKWRESLNAFNPFFVHVKGDRSFSVLENKPTNHCIELDIKKALFSRFSEYDELIITSKRFVSHNNLDTLCMIYTVKAKTSISLKVTFGIDENVWDINGPHYKSIEHGRNENKLTITGISNEGKYIKTIAAYKSNKPFRYKNGLFEVDTQLNRDEEITIEVCSQIIIGEEQNRQITCYDDEFDAHHKIMDKKWENCEVVIDGDEESRKSLAYSIYHLIILGNNEYTTSIPARGLSGQTYKGAIFWDTEVFMLPFFILTDVNIAKKLVQYRINTLPGALRKAKRFNCDGAFYAWESQETGDEACSLYNVSDAISGKPIRTYFADKQIHISGDVSFGIIRYIEATGDYNILYEGGFETLIQITKFFINYSVFNSQKDRYEIHDVIGPDEYHERVNNNAFTNYLVYFTTKKIIDYASLLEGDYVNKILSKCDLNINAVENYVNKLYLPQPNNDNVIEQFDGYFALEDATVKEVRSRLKNEKEYWGGENGVATKTRIIKQADVIALMGMFPEEFSYEELKANYDFYEPYTEHGSSLSASMHSLVACKIGYFDEAYKMFLKSATVDLGENQKQWAGSIYIGGTHPASNGGSYLSIVYGFLGVRINSNKVTFDPHLPDNFNAITYSYVENNVKKTLKFINNKQ